MYTNSRRHTEPIDATTLVDHMMHNAGPINLRPPPSPTAAGTSKKVAAAHPKTTAGPSSSIPGQGASQSSPPDSPSDTEGWQKPTKVARRRSPEKTAGGPDVPVNHASPRMGRAGSPSLDAVMTGREELVGRDIDPIIDAVMLEGSSGSGWLKRARSPPVERRPPTSEGRGSGRVSSTNHPSITIPSSSRLDAAGSRTPSSGSPELLADGKEETKGKELAVVCMFPLNREVQEGANRHGEELKEGKSLAGDGQMVFSAGAVMPPKVLGGSKGKGHGHRGSGGSKMNWDGSPRLGRSEADEKRLQTHE